LARKIRAESTLRLKYPLGKTAGLALVILVFVSTVAEMLTRADFVRSRLPIPSVGSPVTEFEMKLAQLDARAAEVGHVDCVAIGSSVTELGFDPTAFGSAYKDSIGQGQDIRCYNFGIAGTAATSTSFVAEFIAKEYHPRLIIWGTDPRDYAPRVRAKPPEDRVYMPWLEYRSGNWSIQGWLFDRSYAFRHYLVFRNWTKPSFGRFLANGNQALDGYHDFPPFVKREEIDLANLPDPQKEPELFDMLSDYYVSSDGQAGLKRVVALQRQGTSVLIVEMPTHPTYLYFFDHGKQDYQKFVDQVSDTARSEGAVFWSADSALSIPYDGWYDRNHLNSLGASKFSEWLGQRVGEAVQRGVINDPAR
jgi:hypothetical protein